MDRNTLLEYLKRIDSLLKGNAILYVYGSVPLILLGQEDRTSLDMDVAAPYSEADFADIEYAAGESGLPVNPDETASSDHMEWIQALRLCLPPPDTKSDVVLWQGRKLTIKTLAPARLIASKLIRYDEIDQADVQFLCRQANVRFEDVAAAARLLPAPFRDDVLVRANLANLKTDMQMWMEGET
jgi:hypothetical protein